MSNLRHKLLAIEKKIERFHEPETGLDVYIRRMNGAERDIFQEANIKAHDEAKTKGEILRLKPLLLSLTLCDQDGKRLFDDTNEINSLDSLVIDRLAEKAMAVNGLTQQAREAIEKKLSERIGSGSSSPIDSNEP